jgi:hypothetical protein
MQTQPQFRLQNFIGPQLIPATLVCPTITFDELQFILSQELKISPTDYILCYGDEKDPINNQLVEKQEVDSLRFINYGISIISHYESAKKTIDFCFSFEQKKQIQRFPLDLNAPFGEVFHHLIRLHEESRMGQKKRVKFLITGIFSTFGIKETKSFASTQIVSQVIKSENVDHFIVKRIFFTTHNFPPKFKLDTGEIPESSVSYASSPASHLEITEARCKYCDSLIPGFKLRQHFINIEREGRRYSMCKTFVQNNYTNKH